MATEVTTSFERLLEVTGTRPANAYLLVGGFDATRLASVRLAEVLMGLDVSESQLLAQGKHPDCVEVSPAGANAYLAEQGGAEIMAAAITTPIQALRKVVLLHRAEILGSVLGSALLKTLEEPPPSTTFVLCANDTSAIPDTIVSRCLVLTIPPLPHVEAGQALAQELGAGTDEDEAGSLVRATGSVEFVRLLLSSPQWRDRHRRWLEIPTRLREETVSVLVAELMDDFDAASRELSDLHSQEVEELESHLGEKKAGGGRRSCARV